MIRALAILCLAGCATSGVTIDLQHDTDEERRTKTQLEALLGRYDLSQWLQTRKIVIDEVAIPHSHPVLTLHTRHLRDDLLLLSTFIHEQSHWTIHDHPGTAPALAELRALAPGLPVGFPDGANTEQSSYEHLIVIALERDGLIRVAGELQALQAMAFWATDHYRVLYRFVLDHPGEVWAIVKKHGLAPQSSFSSK